MVAWSKRELLYATLILLLGAGLRFWAIGDRSLNDDEFWVVSEARPGIRYILFEQWRKDIHPPLNLLFFHSWMKLGEADWLLRVPSAVFSLGTICVLIFLAQQVSHSIILSLAAGFLLSISPFALLYAQYVRGYALLGLVSITSALFFSER